MRLIAFINNKAGTFTSETELEKAARENGFDIIIKNAMEIITAGYSPHADENDDAIIAACGGDGTVNSVASHFVNKNRKIGIIPLGTLNHFAKDLKIPPELHPSIQVLRTGKVTTVDTGCINGKVFINNVSIGIYPKSVKERKYLFMRKISKIFSTIISTFKVFFKFPIEKAVIEYNGTKEEVKSPLIFVGNNEYEMEFHKADIRRSLNGGYLFLYYLKCHSRISFIKHFILFLFNRLKESKDFVYARTKEIKIYSEKNTIQVAADGELWRLKPPLHFEINPLSLKIIIPSDG